MRASAQLKINNELFSEQLRIKLVTALTFLIFDCCCVVLTSASKKLYLKLHRKTYYCVKYILKISRFEHVTAYYERIGWLRLKARRNYFIACLFFTEVKSPYNQLLSV